MQVTDKEECMDVMIIIIIYTIIMVTIGTFIQCGVTIGTANITKANTTKGMNTHRQYIWYTHAHIYTHPYTHMYTHTCTYTHKRTLKMIHTGH